MGWEKATSPTGEFWRTLIAPALIRHANLPVKFTQMQGFGDPSLITSTDKLCPYFCMGKCMYAAEKRWIGGLFCPDGDHFCVLCGFRSDCSQACLNCWELTKRGPGGDEYALRSNVPPSNKSSSGRGTARSEGRNDSGRYNYRSSDRSSDRRGGGGHRSGGGGGGGGGGSNKARPSSGGGDRSRGRERGDGRRNASRSPPGRDDRPNKKPRQDKDKSST
jgi:hypothetical protein